MTVSTHAYARTHTSTYVSDKLRNFLKLLVNHCGLNPEGVVDAWSSWVDRAARAWLESGHLESIVIEFFRPGAYVALARWDFPIRYDGNGGDDMWIDRSFFQNAIGKAAAPPHDCTYRILLTHAPNPPHVNGVGPVPFLSLGNLVSREIGTVIATPEIMASARYYRS
jgi:hypothetical protein